MVFADSLNMVFACHKALPISSEWFSSTNSLLPAMESIFQQNLQLCSSITHSSFTLFTADNHEAKEKLM